jgi:hypothetical protein
LAIVSEVARMHGAELSVTEATQDGGTAVRMTFPADPGDAPAGQPLLYIDPSNLVAVAINREVARGRWFRHRGATLPTADSTRGAG